MSASAATDPIVIVERNDGFTYRVDTSAVGALDTATIVGYRNYRVINQPDAKSAADFVAYKEWGDVFQAECVCPKRRWYKKAGAIGKWVFEFNEIGPGEWTCMPVGKVVAK